MTYAELLPLLRPYGRIVVTGAQRSGTTIAAECLAADLGLPCHREEAFGVGGVAAFFAHHQDQTGVWQAPALSALCHHVPRGAVVWMSRPLEEIEASQQRIDWDGEREERRRYHAIDDPRPIAQIKLVWWIAVQAAILGERAFTLDYHSLAGHRLWVPAERRRDFGPRQTRE